MPNPVAHFEIYGDNPQKLAGFYTDLFGWKVDPVPGMEYWMVSTVPTDDKGAPTQPGRINGGLMKRPMPEARQWMSYVSVASLDAALEKLQSLGGTVLRGKMPVSKMGWFAVVADPEVNAFGIWQDDPNAA